MGHDVSKVFADYFSQVGENIPSNVYEALLSIACIGLTLFVFLKRDRRGWKWLSMLLLVEFLVLIYCSTVVFRTYNPEQAHNFTPFWSFKEIYKGNYQLQLPEKLMNVALFMPVGLLFKSTFTKLSWWKMLLIGFAISFSIEVLPYVFKRGFAEFDDVINNVIGCMIGYMFSCVLIRTIKRWFFTKYK